MTELDITQVERRLVEIVRAERREAIGYTLLTVLCTPLKLVQVTDRKIHLTLKGGTY